MRNRARILAAAIEVFREHGVTAPLDLVARGAQVGHGTLYRHFPDRGALVEALIEQRLGALEEYAAQYRGEDLLEYLLVEVCELQLRIPGAVAVVRSDESLHDRLEDVVVRTRAMMAEALQRAQWADVVRADVRLDDVFLCIVMIDGVVAAGAQYERALALMLRALRPPERAGLPAPEPVVDQLIAARLRAARRAAASARR